MSRIVVNRLQFVSSEPDGQGATALYFRPDRQPRYRAGQHGLVVVPRWKTKPFTIASAPEEDLVMLGTTLDSPSRFKTALAALSVHDAVRLIGPLGNFTLDDGATSAVMLAQGIGVTPFRSILRHIATTSTATRTLLVHVGAQHPFRVDTRADAMEARYPTSRDQFESEMHCAASARPDATFMVSGSPAFVKSTVSSLLSRGIEARAIKRDTFYGYGAERSAAPHPNHTPATA